MGNVKSTPFNLDKPLNSYSRYVRLWKTFRLIDKCKGISERRHPMFERNRAMKWMGYLFTAFWLCYLMFFGVVMGNIEAPVEIFDTINGWLPIILALDFSTRLMLTDTPAQEVKQFKLMPLSTSFLINVFLIRRATSFMNIVWLFFFVPFGLMCVVNYYGFIGLFTWCLSMWIIMVANAYWYLLWRTLLNRNMMYLILPVSIYAIVIYFGLFDDDFTQSFFGKEHVQPVYWGFLWYGRWVMEGNVQAYLIPISIIALLYIVNYNIQIRSVYREIADVQEGKVKSREMVFLNRFGIIGEYIKLDIKSIMRNGTIRKSFITGVVCTVMLTSLSAFTPIYDGNLFMKAYISMYCFCCLAVIQLTSLMCPEGNYIDGLMARKESVLSLLKAKFYFNLAMMIIPFCIFLLSVIVGKSSFIESIGCLLFTAGVVLPFLMQMAVYNKSTVPLNAKLTRVRNNSSMQVYISIIALFLPMGVMYVLMVLIPTWAPWIMAGLGIIGIALEPLWMRNIYNRFMARRYANMDGFRNSREFLS